MTTRRPQLYGKKQARANFDFCVAADEIFQSSPEQPSYNKQTSIRIHSPPRHTADNKNTTNRYQNHCKNHDSKPYHNNFRHERTALAEVNANAIHPRRKESLCSEDILGKDTRLLYADGSNGQVKHLRKVEKLPPTHDIVVLDSKAKPSKSIGPRDDKPKVSKTRQRRHTPTSSHSSSSSPTRCHKKIPADDRNYPTSNKTSDTVSSATLNTTSSASSNTTSNAVSNTISNSTSNITSNATSTISDPYLTHCEPLLRFTTHPLDSFSTWSEELSQHLTLNKIAEASFGEVYRLSLPSDSTPCLQADEVSVLKIIALQPPPSTLPTDKRKLAAAQRKLANMSNPSDVASEVQLLQRMTSVPGFTNFRGLHIVQGRPSSLFTSAFHRFNEEQLRRGKETSHFPDPAKKASYGEDQLWAVIEMQDAGSDLERLVEMGLCREIWTVWDLFWSVALSLAKGEEEAQFEHRDLHLGNVCVRLAGDQVPFAAEASEATTQTARKKKNTVYGTTGFSIDPSRKHRFTALDTTIIDYTISRACMTSLPDTTSGGKSRPLPHAEEDIAYHDLNHDTAIFSGDSTDEYQYEIYRYMRSALFFDAPLAAWPEEDQQHPSSRLSKDTINSNHSTTSSSQRSWSQFHPQTNLVWLHFLLYSLLEQMAYPSTTMKKPAKPKPQSRSKSKTAPTAASCSPATEKLAIYNRALELEQVLLQVQEYLYPGAICLGGGSCRAEDDDDGVEEKSQSGFWSARDLVLFAVGQGWLGEEDVRGDDAEYEGFEFEEQVEPLDQDREGDLAEEMHKLKLQE